MIEIPKLRKIIQRTYEGEENANNRKDMDRFLKYYTGKYWREQEKLNPEESGIFANMVFSTVMTIAPMLTDNKPIWSARARKHFLQRAIDIFKDAGDCLWDMLDMDMKLFEWVLDALIMKIGYMKVYFDPSAGERGEGEIAHDVIDPREFVMAPGYTDPWKAPWCGTVSKKPLDYIRRTWPEEGKKILPDGIPAEQLDLENANDYELSDQFATIYEIWIRDDSVIEYMESYFDQEAKEIKKRKKKEQSPTGSAIIVFGKDHEKPLEYKPYPYTHGKSPYVPLYDYKVPHKHMGMGEVDQIENLQLEFNLLLKKISQYVRTWADPDIILDAASGINEAKFKKDRPKGGNVWVKVQGTDPPQAVVMPPINQTCTEFAGSLPKLVEEVTGVTDTTKGVAAKKQRQSAHEISALLETSYTRTRQRVRNLEWSIKRVFELDLELMMQYYDETRQYGRKTDEGYEWVSVSNSADFMKRAAKPVPPEEGEEPKPEDLKAEKDYQDLITYIGDEEPVYAKFDIVIDTNSTLPLDKQSLANLALQLAQTQLTPQSAIDLETLLDILKVPGREKIIEKMKAMQEVQQQQQAQQQPQGGMQ